MNNSFLFFSDFNNGTETSNTSQLNSENPDSGKPLWREIFEKSQLIMTCFGIVANIATIITLMFNGREFSPAMSSSKTPVFYRCPGLPFHCNPDGGQTDVGSR